MEAQEKLKRKNNTVLTGVEFDENNITKELEDFHREQLNVNVKIKTAIKIRNRRDLPMYKIEWKTWQDKSDVMKNKNKLKNYTDRVYIENDLTQEERKIQAELRAIAKEERKKNKNVKVVYKKITIDGAEFHWNKEINGVIGDSNPKN